MNIVNQAVIDINLRISLQFIMPKDINPLTNNKIDY